MPEDLTLAEISCTTINTNFSDIEDAVNAKADLNGDSSEVFEVANATQSTEAVNKGQLDSAVSAIDSDIADLEDELSNLTVNTHFCVNSGNTTDGEGDLLDYSSGTLTTKSGGSYVDIVLTNAQGSEITVNTELSLNMSSYDDGDYNIFITSQGTLEAFSNNIYGQTTEPSSPSTNDIWFNTSVEPVIAYIHDGSDFSTEYTGVPVGRATLESAAITEVETFDFNQNGFEVNFQTQGYRFPDLITNGINGISKANDTIYQAECDGWLKPRISCLGYQSILYYSLNGIDWVCMFTVGMNNSTSLHVYGRTLVPISKGVYYKITVGTNAIVELQFYPAKGAN